MKTITGILSQDMVKARKESKRKFFWQQRFLYPLLFQDDLYAIAYNQFFKEI